MVDAADIVEEEEGTAADGAGEPHDSRHSSDRRCGWCHMVAHNCFVRDLHIRSEAAVIGADRAHTLHWVR